MNHYFKLLTSLLIFLGGFFTIYGQHLYPVSDNGKYGFVNDRGDIILPNSFDSSYYNYEFDLAISILHGYTQLYSTTGKPLLQTAINNWFSLNKLIITQVDSSTSVYRYQNKKLILLEKVDSIIIIKNGTQQYLSAFKNGLNYLIDDNGENHFKSLQLLNFTPLDNIHFLVLNKDSLKGVIDINSTPYLPIEYREIDNYNGGLRFTSPNGLVGYKKTHFYLKSKNGNRALTYFPANYSSIDQFGTHYLRLKRNNDVILYHIKKGQLITKTFNPNARPFTESHHIYQSGQKYGLCDLYGKELTDAVYTQLHDSKHPTIIIFKRDNKYGFMSSNGKELTTANFDKLFPFKENGISARSFSKYLIDNLYGLVGINGDTICGPQYLNIRLISDDRAACVRQDSSARVFIINTSSGEMEDFYDIRDIKLLEVEKYYAHTGTENLSTKISPYEYGLYTYNVFNTSLIDGIERQHNINDFSKIELTKISMNKLFFRYSLNENSFAPLDESISIFSVDHVDRPERMSAEQYSDRSFKSASIIDNQFIYAIDYSNQKHYFDLHLQNLSLPINTDYQTYTVTDFYQQSDYYPRVFKTSTSSSKKPIFLVIGKGYQKHFIEPRFDSLIFQKEIIFGRENNYWYNATNDSIEVPSKTTQLSVTNNLYLAKQVKRSTFIYDKHGELTLEFDSINIINESINGYILIQKDSLFNYITPKGHLLLTEWVKHASPFENGFAYLTIEEKYDVINKKGEVIIRQLNKPPYFNQNGVSTYYHMKKFGLLDTNNTIIDSAKYAKLSPINNTALFSYKKIIDEPFGIINSNGIQVTTQSFKTINQLNNSLLIINKKGSSGIADDSTGNILIPTKYDKIKPVNAFFITRRKGKFGLFNELGTEILPNKYLSISDFRYGYLTAKSKRETIYIKDDGSIYIEEPEKIRSTPTCIIEFIADSSSDGFVGISSLNIPTQFNEISPLKNGGYLLVKHHQFLLNDFTGNNILQSNKWKSAKILDNKIAIAETKEGIKYYNIILHKWIN